MSLKTGIWNFGFLLAGVMIVVTFAILFALMTFLGVTIRSGPFSLMCWVPAGTWYLETAFIREIQFSAS